MIENFIMIAASLIFLLLGAVAVMWMAFPLIVWNKLEAVIRLLKTLELYERGKGRRI